MKDKESGVLFGLPQAMGAAPLTLQAAAESFYLDRQANGCSHYTLRWYRTYTKALLAWLVSIGITDLASVTSRHMRTWLVSLRESGLADRTIHHHASAARTFFNFCASEGLVPSSPMLKVRMPRLPKDIQPAFSVEDVHAILQACRSDRDRAIVLCLLDTGCRASEFVALTVGDVDTITGAIIVRHGKGSKDRVVFLGAKALAALKAYLQGRSDAQTSQALWLGETTHKGLTSRGLQRLLYRLGQSAAVSNCHPHTFRRSFALWSLRAGMDIFSLQRLLGHANLEMLRRYLNQVRDDIERAHRLHGAVDTLLGACML